MPHFAKRCESDCLLQLLGFLPVCLIHPSFHVALLGAREWPGTLLYFHPCDSLYHQYPNLPPFLLPPPSRFAGYLPVNMLCTSWTCLSLSHRNLCIFICIFVLYHTWKALTLKQIFFQIFGTQVSVNQMHTIEDYFLSCYCLQARCPTLLHTGWENPGLQHQFPLENHLSHFQSLSELLILHKCTVSGFENNSWCIHNCLTHARSKYKFPLLTFEAHRPHSGRCVRLVLTCRVTH